MTDVILFPRKSLSCGVFLMTGPSLTIKSLFENPQTALESWEEFKGSNQSLLQGMDFPDSILIYATGRFAPLDRKSPMHLIIICDAETRGQIEQKVDSCFKESLIPIAGIEWKDPSHESLCSCNLTDTIIPSRFLQSHLLVGTPERHKALICKFVKDVQEMSGKKRQKFRRKFFLNHRRQLKAVIDGKNKRGLNLANGVIFYDARRSQATKYSLLDSIQYFLDLRIIDTIREKRHWPKEYESFVKHLPRTVPEQIDYLYLERVLSNLSPQDIKDLKKAYSIGLLYFQTAQRLFIASKHPVEFPVSDKTELQKAYADTLRILTR